MRGFPPIQIFIVLTAFILLSIPLWRLTNGGTFEHLAEKPSELETLAPKADNSIEAELIIRCAHAPKKLVVMDTAGERASFVNEGRWPQYISLRLEKGFRVELAIEAIWGDEVEATAVTLELSPEAGETVSATRWSIGNKMDDVFTFNRS